MTDTNPNLAAKFQTSTKSSGLNMSELAVGSNVIVVGTTKKPGIVEFIGETQFAPGEWIGVRLFTPEGKNDGSIQDVKYFDCQPMHGLFVRRPQVQVMEPSKEKPDENVSVKELPARRVSDVNDIDKKLSAAASQSTSNRLSLAPKPRPSVTISDVQKLIGGNAVGRPSIAPKDADNAINISKVNSTASTTPSAGVFATPSPMVAESRLPPTRNSVSKKDIEEFLQSNSKILPTGRASLSGRSNGDSNATMLPGTLTNDASATRMEDSKKQLASIPAAASTPLVPAVQVSPTSSNSSALGNVAPATISTMVQNIAPCNTSQSPPTTTDLTVEDLPVVKNDPTVVTQDSFNIKLKQFELKVEALQIEIKKEIVLHEGTRTQLTKVKEDCRAEREDLLKQIEELNYQYENLLLDKEQLSLDNELLEETIASLKKQISNLNQPSHNSQTTSSDLDLSKLQSENRDLRRLVTHLHEKSELESQRLKQKEESERLLTSRLRDTERKLEDTLENEIRMQADLESLKETCDLYSSYDQLIEDLSEKNNNLNTEVARLQTNSAELTSMVEVMEDIDNSQREMIEKLNRKLASLEAHHTENQQSLTDQLRVVTDLANANKQLKETVALLHENLRTLEASVHEKEEALRILARRNNDGPCQTGNGSHSESLLNRSAVILSLESLVRKISNVRELWFTHRTRSICESNDVFVRELSEFVQNEVLVINSLFMSHSLLTFCSSFWWNNCTKIKKGDPNFYLGFILTTISTLLSKHVLYMLESTLVVLHENSSRDNRNSNEVVLRHESYLNRVGYIFQEFIDRVNVIEPDEKASSSFLTDLTNEIVVIHDEGKSERDIAVKVIYNQSLIVLMDHLSDLLGKRGNESAFLVSESLQRNHEDVLQRAKNVVLLLDLSNIFFVLSFVDEEASNIIYNAINSNFSKSQSMSAALSQLSLLFTQDFIPFVKSNSSDIVLGQKLLKFLQVFPIVGNENGTRNVTAINEMSLRGLEALQNCISTLSFDAYNASSLISSSLVRDNGSIPSSYVSHLKSRTSNFRSILQSLSQDSQRLKEIEGEIAHKTLDLEKKNEEMRLLLNRVVELETILSNQSNKLSKKDSPDSGDSSASAELKLSKEAISVLEAKLQQTEKELKQCRLTVGNKSVNVLSSNNDLSSLASTGASQASLYDNYVNQLRQWKIMSTISMIHNINVPSVDKNTGVQEQTRQSLRNKNKILRSALIVKSQQQIPMVKMIK